MTDRHWPAPLSRDAYQGIVGEYVDAVTPHTEGDPAAVLVQTLVCLGNAMGRGPHFWIEDTRHGTNLNTVVVGDTSAARKGTSLARARRLAQLADPSWGANNDGEGGLSTAEGLISAVRDPSRRADGAEDQGNDDKRLLAAMGEFGETLSKMRREGNTLGATLRAAWDGSTLRIRTRSQPLVATNAHVSVIGHITQADLAALLGQTDIFNGFGNRFLWVMAKRSKHLPHGGSLRVDDLDELLAATRSALNWAEARTKPIEFDAVTRKAWEETLYEELGRSAEGPFGAITDRAEAQVRRLALVYAAMDRSSSVKRGPLKAALEVWRYCADSAAYLFDDAPGDPIEGQIVKHLTSRRGGAGGGWTPTSALTRAMRTATSYQLSSALAGLASRGLIEERRVPTRGRPRTDYRLVMGGDS